MIGKLHIILQLHLLDTKFHIFIRDYVDSASNEVEDDDFVDRKTEYFRATEGYVTSFLQSLNFVNFNFAQVPAPSGTRIPLFSFQLIAHKNFITIYLCKAVDALIRVTEDLKSIVSSDHPLVTSNMAVLDELLVFNVVVKRNGVTAGIVSIFRNCSETWAVYMSIIATILFLFRLVLRPGSFSNTARSYFTYISIIWGRCIDLRICDGLEYLLPFCLITLLYFSVIALYSTIELHAILYACGFLVLPLNFNLLFSREESLWKSSLQYINVFIKKCKPTNGSLFFLHQLEDSERDEIDLGPPREETKEMSRLTNVDQEICIICLSELSSLPEKQQTTFPNIVSMRAGRRRIDTIKTASTDHLFRLGKRRVLRKVLVSERFRSLTNLTENGETKESLGKLDIQRNDGNYYLYSRRRDSLCICLNDCGHVYHTVCLMAWREAGRQKSDNCPICDKSLTGKDKLDFRSFYCTFILPVYIYLRRNYSAKLLMVEETFVNIFRSLRKNFSTVDFLFECCENHLSRKLE